ncbi:hypothetical protein pipiens_015012 [Culex pipiens pipiens]|uniref:Uncharacterized protein n=1 Tax=Culex pipiens pipiens TaxID=38569 RepID=A0ABD1CS79_CULPP
MDSTTLPPPVPSSPGGVGRKKKRPFRLEPLKIDVIDLTLLLKSMGLKLEFLNFEQEKSNADTFTVEIKCNRSGVRAKLAYDLIECTCPEKDEKEASFWEVQGTGPKAFSKGRNDTSSNLLPEVSENCSMVSKAMLTNLLDFYKSSMKSVERGEDVLNSPLRVATPRICVTSPTGQGSPPDGAHFADRNAWNRSTDFDSKMDPALSPMKPKSAEGSVPSSSGASSQHDDTKSNNSSEGMEINNATRELYNTDSNEKVAILPTPEKPTGMPDDSSFANSEAMQAIITSSPNEKIFESLMRANQNDERDANVIHCLQQARHQIDAALLVMKLNNPNGPDQQALPKFPDRTGSLGGINRRMSLPGPLGRTPTGDQSKSTTILGSGGSLLKKKVSQLVTASSKVIANRGDTPRPNPAQLKAVSALRKTNSASSVLGAAAPKVTVSAPAKPAPVKKTAVKALVGSVRPPAVKPVAGAKAAGGGAGTTGAGGGKK